MFASLSSTRSGDRKRSIYYMRRMTFTAVLIYFVLILLHDYDGYVVAKTTNGSVDAIVSVVPTVTGLYTEKTLNQLHVNRNLTKRNDMKTVLNEGSFASLTNDSLIIVVQVHTRVTYLGYLIGSLGQSRNIGKVLLIFSHDYYDADINELVKSIKFCDVIQIFYPYPVHWHPKCPQDAEETSDKCNVAELSEHGKRTALVQMKHHWWWKTNYVFDQLEITRYYTGNIEGLVLFLEEDHYVAEDFLYVLEMMYKLSTQLCRKCNILSLGTYFEASDNYTYDGEITVCSHHYLVPDDYGAHIVTEPMDDLVDETETPNHLNVDEDLDERNGMATVLNGNLFGPLTNNSLIIVVQVHIRITYLRYLIGSLPKAFAIETVLLVFSHDYYDEDINDLVESIKFCRVVQIFYPYAVHSHPKCAEDSEETPEMRRKCENAEFRGHKSHKRRVQLKHHWWWKVNYVFDQLHATKFFTGLVLFLEEDNYVAQDFIYVLTLMYKRIAKLCPQCNVLSIGPDTVISDYYEYNSTRSAEVEVMPWSGYATNMGFAFNRTTWNNIRRCAEYFCFENDYNWDVSLESLSNKCPHGQLLVMIVKEPRVFHLGRCGVHMKSKKCKSNETLLELQTALRVALRSGHLFPRKLNLTETKLASTTHLDDVAWDQKRDHQLCMNMISPSRSISVKKTKVE
uniref:Alpha-1,6-mannosyl-glycoprotein 2-beta-N-acetylglucosaminyltransferase n=1 Tax=Glossina morsitans morsitans TaxID=37546 RepID=A0A340TZT3_GLOMM